MTATQAKAPRVSHNSRRFLSTESFREILRGRRRVVSSSSRPHPARSTAQVRNILHRAAQASSAQAKPPRAHPQVRGGFRWHGSDGLLPAPCARACFTSQKEHHSTTSRCIHSSSVGSWKKICSRFKCSSSWSKSANSRSFRCGLKTRLVSISRRCSAAFAKNALYASGCSDSSFPALPFRKSKYAGCSASLRFNG